MTPQPRSYGSLSRRSAKAALAIGLASIVALASVPAGAQTLVDVTIQNPAFHDFDDGPQDWTALPGGTPVRPDPTATWEWGAPTSGPGVAASGSNVWATNIDGLYGGNECAGLATPPIDLSSASAASISYKHWRHMDQFSATSSFVSDAGAVLVTADGGSTFTVVTASDYTTNSISSIIRSCFDGASTSLRGYTGPHGSTPPAPTYNTGSVDLSAFAGQTIQVVFTFASNCCTHRAGWYLDDVAVTIDDVTSVEDFESDDGGFTAIGTKVAPPVPLGWSHGVPQGGPASDSPMWSTNINGDYGPSECHWMESPPIDLGPLPPEAAAAATATLSWQQWFRSSSSSGAGVVQVGLANGTYVNIVPTTDYPANPSSTVLNACLGHREAGGAFAGFIDPVGGPMTEFEADLTEFLGQTITIRYLFASSTSTFTYPGWYVDDVYVEVAATVEAPSVGGPPSIPAPGWSSGGPVSTWSYGVTQSNPVGHTAYKTNLDGNHDLNECSYIESPAVPGGLVAGAGLSFEHWHRIPGTSVNVPWAAGIVLVSVDEGATWTHVAMPDYNKAIYQSPSYTEIFNDCLSEWGADIAGGGYGKDSATVSGNVAGWYTSSVDLSEHATAPTVKIRFAYASDGTFAYEGWAIRSVTLGGVKIL